MTSGAARALSLLPVLAAVLGCGAGSRTQPVPTPEQVVVAAYRGSVTSPGGKRVPFRAWVWAERPDRMHVEILPPLGGPEWIVDAGSGRLAVTEVGAGACFAGEETPGALSRWLGVPIDVPGLVASLVDADGSFPEVYELRGDALGELRMERTGFRLAPRGALGRGEPPPEIHVAPLEELVDRAFAPGEDEAGR